jgi:hypothetical protein
MYTTPEPRRLSFTIAEMVGLTFRIYLQNIVPLLILSTVIVIVGVFFGQFITSGLGLNSLVTGNTPSTGQLSAAIQNSIIFLIITLVIAMVLAVFQYVLTYGPITYLTSEHLMGNRGLGFQAMFKGASPRLGSLAGGYIVYIVVAAITFIGVTLIGVVCFPLLVGLVPLIYLFSCMGFVFAPVLMLERMDFAAALSRAWVLGKARFWTGMGLFFLLGLCILLIQLPQLIIAWPTLAETFQAGAGAAGRLQQPIVQSPLSLIVSTVSAILILPLVPIASTLFYYDTRTRTEGLDAALAALDTPDARPHHLPSPMQGGGLTSQDFLNMLALVGIGVVIALALAAASLSLFSLLQNALPPGFLNQV